MSPADLSSVDNSSNNSSNNSSSTMHEVMKPAPRSCSLRSTQLTTSSDSTSASSSFEPACFGEWAYWQRDSEGNPECWTKVFAVITRDDASICLYQCEDMSRRTLVRRYRMQSVTAGSNRRRLKLVDARGLVITRLWLLNHANHELWKTCLQSAVQVAALTPPTSSQSTPSSQSTNGDATYNSSQSIVSRMSLASLRRHHETQGTRVSKRSIVKAVCRDAVAQIRGRLQGMAER